MTESRDERALRTREHILETAAAAFARSGLAGTSLNEIVRSSGLTKGAFYHHFASKEALAFAVFREKQQQLVRRLMAEAGEAADGLSALVAIVRARARVYATEPAFRVVQRLGAELDSIAGPGSEYAGFQELPIESFAGLLRRGQAEGVVRADVDPRAAAEVVFAALIGMDDVSFLLSGGRQLERHTEALVDVLLNGLAAGPSRKEHIR